MPRPRSDFRRRGKHGQRSSGLVRGRHRQEALVGWHEVDRRLQSPQTHAVGSPAGAAPTIEAAVGGADRPNPTAQAPSYVVLQVILKEKLWGTGSGNLTELEKAINAQAARGYRPHTITTAASGSKGLGGGDRIQATMVFERLP